MKDNSSYLKPNRKKAKHRDGTRGFNTTKIGLKKKRACLKCGRAVSQQRAPTTAYAKNAA